MARMTNRSLVVLSLTLGVLSSISGLVHASAIVSDETFNNSDWERLLIRSTGSYSDSATQAATGGNPGAYRVMTHTWGSGTQVLLAHIFLADTYDPGASGAISSIDYYEDQRILSSPGGSVVGRGAVVVQDDILYRTGIDVVLGSTTWETWSLLDLDAADFSGPGGAHPDFSGGGHELSFGYWRSNTIPAQHTP
jgi:hypothetical protein